MLRRLRLLHPFPSLLATLLTVGLIPIADGDAPLALYLQLGLGMLCYQLAIGIANDLSDAEVDAESKPWKAIPSGLVTRRRARQLATALVAIGLVVTLPLPLDAWLIGIAGLMAGLSYDVFLKRTVLSFLPWAVAFPLVPVWVFRAAGEWDALLWWTFPLGVLLGFALNLANQAPESARERDLGVQGLAQLLGTRASVRLALSAFGLAASTATIVLLFAEPSRAPFSAAAAIVGLVMAPRAARFFGRDGLFGLLAASTAILAAVFLSAV